jgi:hypothetical protein
MRFLIGLVALVMLALSLALLVVVTWWRRDALPPIDSGAELLRRIDLVRQREELRND